MLINIFPVFFGVLQGLLCLHQQSCVGMRLAIAREFHLDGYCRRILRVNQPWTPAIRVKVRLLVLPI